MVRAGVVVAVLLAACSSFGSNTDTSDPAAGDASASSSSSGGPDPNFCVGYTYCDQFENGPAAFWTNRPSNGASIATVDLAGHGKVLEVSRPAAQTSDAELYVQDVPVPKEGELWYSVLTPPPAPGIISTLGIACDNGYITIGADANVYHFQGDPPPSEGTLGRSNVARKVAFTIANGRITVTTGDGLTVDQPAPQLTGPCAISLGVIAYNGESGKVQIDDFRLR